VTALEEEKWFLIDRCYGLHLTEGRKKGGVRGLSEEKFSYILGGEGAGAERVRWWWWGATGGAGKLHKEGGVGRKGGATRKGGEGDTIGQT